MWSVMTLWISVNGWLKSNMLTIQSVLKATRWSKPLSRVLPLTVLLLVHKGNTLTASTSNTSTATTSGSRLNYPPQFIDNEKDLPTSEESWVPQVPQTICISQGCQQGAWLFLSNWDRISTCYCLDCCCCNACCLSLQGSRICPCQRQHV